MDKTGVTEMLTNKRVDELKHLYQLLSRVPTTQQYVIEKLKPYIVNRGEGLKKDKDVTGDPVKYMTLLVELKKEMDTLMQDSFAGEERFIRTNDLAFQDIMDAFDRSPQYLAYYIDFIMTKGLRGKEAEMEPIVDNAFGLFKLLKPKDAFTEHHKALYAVRLLQHTTISDAAEELLISKMKIELGAQNVSKYVQMSSDMKNSRDVTESFKKQHHKGSIKGIELSAKVLTSGLWGSEQNEVCKMPEELQDCYKTFETYYKQIHAGRNLILNAGLGDCEVKANSFAKPYTFILTVYQTSVLCLFNHKDIYTFKELCEATKMNGDVLSKQIFNLVNPKMGKLLIKANLKTPSFTADETVTLNSAFSSASLRLSLIPAPPKKVIRNIQKNRVGREEAG